MSSTKIIENKLAAAKSEYDEAVKLLTTLQNEIRNTEARAWGLQGAIQVLESTLKETTASETTDEPVSVGLRTGLATAKAKK